MQDEKKVRGPRNHANTKLKALRVSKGMTQGEVAEKTNINIRMLQYYEQGSKLIDNARIDVILKLCVALECKISDIVESDDIVNIYDTYERER